MLTVGSGATVDGRAPDTGNVKRNVLPLMTFAVESGGRGGELQQHGPGSRHDHKPSRR